MRNAGDAATPNRPTIYYYADQTGPPLDRVGPARFRVPRRPKPARAVLDANVVSSGYFDAMGLSLIAGKVFPDDPRAGGCRVGVINQEAADLYFGGNAVGAAVIDNGRPPHRNHRRRPLGHCFAPSSAGWSPRSIFRWRRIISLA